MKRLRAIDPVRQQMWEHEGKRYSIVDLCIPPEESDGHRYDIEKWNDLMSFYKPFNFELAELTENTKPTFGVDVLGRYISYASARLAIKTGEAHGK